MGCGEGTDAVFFAKCGYNVSAFDISEQGIEKARNLAGHNKVNVNFVTVQPRTLHLLQSPYKHVNLAKKESAPR